MDEANKTALPPLIWCKGDRCRFTHEGNSIPAVVVDSSDAAIIIVRTLAGNVRYVEREKLRLAIEVNESIND